MNDVIPFPVKAPDGPPFDEDAWVCGYCDHNDTKFAFYILKTGLRCWTCHQEPIFP